MESNKYMWNPAYKGMTIYYKGIAVKVGEPIEQNIMESFYNDPNRNGLVLMVEQVKSIQPEVIAVGEPEQLTTDPKTKAKEMFEQGMSITQISKALQLSYPTIKKYVNS